MCGIVGIFHTDRARSIDERLLQAMCDSIVHRGPDDEGRYVFRHAGVAARRLSIIGVTSGHQPIPNEDETIWVALNGEIYNYQALRADLRVRGHRFRTDSDTECIVHLYEEYGERCVEHLRGMFAFAVLDARDGSLFVARDRLGIKPLFHTFDGERLLIGSEMKAILRDPSVPREIDPDALDAYFTYGYVPAPLTIYRSIRKLEAGHSLHMSTGAPAIRQYWDVRFDPDENRSDEDLAEEFLATLDEAVRLHLLSEVPLGAFLSGGIDSGLIVALMAGHLDAPTKTFTMGFGGSTAGYLDERGYAASVAARYRAEHREHEVQPSLPEIIDPIVEAFDEPFADDSVIPSYYICKLARQEVTVALTGLGGDELFAGYERYVGLALSEAYQAVPRVVRDRVIGPLIDVVPDWSLAGQRVHHAKRFLRATDGSPAARYQRYVSYLDEESRLRLYTGDLGAQVNTEATADLAMRHFRAPSAADPLDRAMYQDLKMYLPDDILALSDRLSMHHSLEIRVPFVDHKVVEMCARIPARKKLKGLEKKHLLKQVARRFLPADVISHRKQGFASPMASWLRADLAAYAREELSPVALARHGLFESVEIGRLLDEHQSGRESHDRALFALMMFQRWERTRHHG